MSKLKGIYLASFTANHPNHYIIYQDKNGKKRWLSSQNLPRDKRQGGKDVHEIIELFINTIEKGDYHG